jgi:hypothetical protein
MFCLVVSLDSGNAGEIPNRSDVAVFASLTNVNCDPCVLFCSLFEFYFREKVPSRTFRMMLSLLPAASLIQSTSFNVLRSSMTLRQETDLFR